MESYVLSGLVEVVC